MRLLLATFIICSIFTGALLPVFVSGQTTTTFYVDSEFEGKQAERVRHILSSEHTNIFIEDEYYSALDEEKKKSVHGTLEKAALAFDTQTYDSVRELLGYEAVPGIDGDARFTFYFSQMTEDKDTLGYFRDIDNTNNATSNRREMAYINTNLIGSARLTSALAHEFTHSITYNQHTRLYGVAQERWLSEGLAEYVATAAGFAGTGGELSRRVSAFKASPNVSLAVWENVAANYGAAVLFIHYLSDQYGQALISAVAQSELVGSAAVTRALKDNGIAKDFSRVYAEWTATLFLNQDVDDTGVYAYKNPVLDFLTLNIQPRTTFTLGRNTTVQASTALQDFSAQWYRFMPESLDYSNPLFLNLSFKTLDKNDIFFIPVIRTSTTGYVDVSFFTVEGGEAQFDIENFNTLSSVVIIPASHTSLAGFDGGENSFRILTPFASLSAFRQNMSEGDLIRAEGTRDVYVIKEGFRRLIQNSAIMDFYGHLSWASVRDVPAAQRNDFKESKLIRLAGGYKVYEVGDGNTKHWLDMTPKEFEESGRIWDAVFEVNEKEFNWLKAGDSVRF